MKALPDRCGRKFSQLIAQVNNDIGGGCDDNEEIPSGATRRYAGKNETRVCRKKKTGRL